MYVQPNERQQNFHEQELVWQSRQPLKVASIILEIYRIVRVLQKLNFILALTFSYNGLLSIFTLFISCVTTLVHFASTLLNRTTFVPP